MKYFKRSASDDTLNDNLKKNGNRNLPTDKNVKYVPV